MATGTNCTIWADAETEELANKSVREAGHRVVQDLLKVDRAAVDAQIEGVRQKLRPAMELQESGGAAPTAPTTPATPTTPAPRGTMPSTDAPAYPPMGAWIRRVTYVIPAVAFLVAVAALVIIIRAVVAKR